jgi:membrane protease YdiL (CAAX protease family)
MSESLNPAIDAPAIGWSAKLGAAFSMLAIYFGIQGLSLLCRVTPRLFSAEQLRQEAWIGLFEHHFLQMLFALILIGLYSRGRFSDWGLNLRNARISWRIFFWFVPIYSLIILAVNVFPAVIAHQAPSFDYPLTRANIVGWLAFECLFVGISEEILFRGLIHTFLAQTWCGVWNVGRVAVPTAGIVTTIIFCIAHMDVLHHWHVSWLQQLWALGFGLYYSIVYHRTGSLFNPILAHNYGDGIIFISLYLTYWWLR